MKNNKLYLKSLTLKNFATFENQTVQFENNFNGIIGETGSGKSLILDAFQLILGSRSQKKMIRKGYDFAVVEGTFIARSQQVSAFFDQLGYPLDDGEIILKRIIYKDGKTKSFLNNLSCKNTTFSKFARNYIDLVGQFENQKLLSPEYQISLLDEFSKLNPDVESYSSIYHQYVLFTKKLEELKEKAKVQAQRREFLKYQIDELSILDPSLQDEIDLEKRKNAMVNAQSLWQELERIREILEGDQSGVLNGLSRISTTIDKIASMLPPEIVNNLNSAISLLEDVSFSLNQVDLEENSDSDLEEVLEKLDLYQKLKRKYSCDTESLIQLKSDFEKELNDLDDIEFEIKKTSDRVSDLYQKGSKLAKRLHAERLLHAETLEKELSQTIQQLNMKGAQIKVEVSELTDLTPYGFSHVQFLAETNKGEGFYPIKSIASGGELSRILLAVRKVISGHDSISVFFFDEIDTGIGGNTAVLIGKMLQEVSLKTQVMAITHLPQIAKFVDNIIYVDKETSKEKGYHRTSSFVTNIEHSEKNRILNELAGLGK
jgi:DNA repair protein RecN (Recombination protein N)